MITTIKQVLQCEIKAFETFTYSKITFSELVEMIDDVLHILYNFILYILLRYLCTKNWHFIFERYFCICLRTFAFAINTFKIIIIYINASQICQKIDLDLFNDSIARKTYIYICIKYLYLYQ